MCRKEFHQVWPSTPIQAQEDRGWDNWGGHSQSLRYKYKRRVSRVGVGLTVGWGEHMWEAEPPLRTPGWQEGPAQPPLPTGFLGGDTQAGSLPQGILVVTGTAPAPALPTADTAHSRDAAAAVGHVATADRAGPEAIATATAGAADDGCRGRAGQHPSGRAGGNGLGGGSSHSCPYPQVKISLGQLPLCSALGSLSLYPIWLILNSQRLIFLVQTPVYPPVILDTHSLPFLLAVFVKLPVLQPLPPVSCPTMVSCRSSGLDRLAPLRNPEIHHCHPDLPGPPFTNSFSLI